jgi:hypothetical protein
MDVTSSQAYYVTISITTVKSYILQVPGESEKINDSSPIPGTGAASFSDFNSTHLFFARRSSTSVELQLHLAQLARPQLLLGGAPQPRENQIRALLHRDWKIWKVTTLSFLNVLQLYFTTIYKKPLNSHLLWPVP